MNLAFTWLRRLMVWVAILAVIGLAGGVAIWKLNRADFEDAKAGTHESTQSKRINSSSDQLTLNPRPAADATEPSVIDGGVRNLGVTSEKNAIRSKEIERTALVDMYSRWEATSEQDAMWLKRHGFPDSAQEEFLATASEAVLKQMSAAGDLVAQVELAHKMAEDDERKWDALGLLSDAAARGSVRAVSAKGEVLGDMMANSMACRDLNAAATFLVATMLGDSSAVHGYLMCSRGLPAEAQASVVLLASSILAEIRAEQIDRFPDSSCLEPRPGLRRH